MLSFIAALDHIKIIDTYSTFIG